MLTISCYLACMFVFRPLLAILFRKDHCHHSDTLISKYWSQFHVKKDELVQAMFYIFISRFYILNAFTFIYDLQVFGPSGVLGHRVL